MSKAKGAPKSGGRQKGSVNKVTADVRAAIAKLAEGNVRRCQGWLNRIAKDDPEAALNAFMRMLEYHIPKLNRSEVTGAGGGPLEVSIVRFTDPKPDDASPPAG